MISFLAMVGFGSALQHTDVSANCILLMMTLIPFPVSLILEIFVLGKKNLFLLDPLSHGMIGSSLTYFIISIVLIIAPQIVTYIFRMSQDQLLIRDNEKIRKQYSDIRNGSGVQNNIDF